MATVYRAFLICNYSNISVYIRSARNERLQLRKQRRELKSTVCELKKDRGRQRSLGFFATNGLSSATVLIFSNDFTRHSKHCRRHIMDDRGSARSYRPPGHRGPLPLISFFFRAHRSHTKNEQRSTRVRGCSLAR